MSAVVQKGLEASSKKLIRAFTAPTYSPYPVKYAYLTVMIQRNRPAVLNDSVSAVGFWRTSSPAYADNNLLLWWRMISLPDLKNIFLGFLLSVYPKLRVCRHTLTGVPAGYSIIRNDIKSKPIKMLTKNGNPISIIFKSPLSKFWCRFHPSRRAWEHFCSYFFRRNSHRYIVLYTFLSAKSRNFLDSFS